MSSAGRYFFYIHFNNLGNTKIAEESDKHAKDFFF